MQTENEEQRRRATLIVVVKMCQNVANDWILYCSLLLNHHDQTSTNCLRAVNVEGRSSWRITAHTVMYLKVWTIRRNAKQKQNNVCLEILKQRFRSTCPLLFQKSCFPVSWLTALALGSTLCHCVKRWTYPRCFEYFCPCFLWRKIAETWHLNLSRTRQLNLLGFTSWAHGGDRGRHTASHTAHRRQCLFLLNKEMTHIAQRCSKPLSFRSRRTLKQ